MHRGLYASLHSGGGCSPRRHDSDFLGDANPKANNASLGASGGLRRARSTSVHRKGGGAGADGGGAGAEDPAGRARSLGRRNRSGTHDRSVSHERGSAEKLVQWGGGVERVVWFFGAA